MARQRQDVVALSIPSQLSYPLLQKAFGRWVTSTDILATVMLQLAVVGSGKDVEYRGAECDC